MKDSVKRLWVYKKETNYATHAKCRPWSREESDTVSHQKSVYQQQGEENPASFKKNNAGTYLKASYNEFYS